MMMVESSNSTDINFNVDNTIISMEDDVDFLGMNIDNKLKIDKHITGLCRKVRLVLNWLF